MGDSLFLHLGDEGSFFSLFAQGYFPQKFTYDILVRGGERGVDGSDLLGVGQPLGHPRCEVSGAYDCIRRCRRGCRQQGAVSIV